MNHYLVAHHQRQGVVSRTPDFDRAVTLTFCCFTPCKTVVSCGLNLSARHPPPAASSLCTSFLYPFCNHGLSEDNKSISPSETFRIVVITGCKMVSNTAISTLTGGNLTNYDCLQSMITSDSISKFECPRFVVANMKECHCSFNYSRLRLVEAYIE